MHKPDSYRLVIEMSGDRVEKGRFEVQINSGKVTNIRRNGVAILGKPGQDYSMEGLFHMLEQELSLAEKPAMLGTPEGYSVYLNARFDDANRTPDALSPDRRGCLEFHRGQCVGLSAELKLTESQLSRP